MLRRGSPSRWWCLLAACVLLAAGGGVASGQPGPPPAPAVGVLAPNFVLPYATQDTIVFHGDSLSQTAARSPVLLAFYPADWSGGCTREVCMLRDAMSELAALGVTVWGISGDYVFSHQAWAQHHHLPFRLLSDHDHEVARAYGSYLSDRGYNRRTVFVVGTDRRIAYEDLDYSVTDDSDFTALRQALADLRTKKQP